MAETLDQTLIESFEELVLAEMELNRRSLGTPSFHLGKVTFQYKYGFGILNQQHEGRGILYLGLAIDKLLTESRIVFRDGVYVLNE